MNEPYFPEASDPDTYVRGRLAPPTLARQVKLGWKVGAAYVALKVVASLFLSPEELSSPLIATLAAAEVALAAGLVFGVYRWRAWAAWSLLALLVASAFAGAWHPPQTSMPGGAQVRIAFLFGFGVVFGRAAIAIRKFERSASQATPSK